MRAATCFSGIGAPEQAMPGWSWRWHAEIEPFPAAVMVARHPGSVNLGDVLAADFLVRAAAEPIDVLVGGPPCQAFSVAGLRGGLADPRGNLSLRWVQIIHAARPRYAVTENVPGWLSSSDNAFGCFLGALVGADDALFPPTGYGWPSAGMVAGPLMRAAWRILDAQYFGLAQRRQRVFIVACPVGEGDPAEVLFERASLRRDTPSRREARQDVAGTIEASLGRRCGQPNDHDPAGGLVVAGTLGSNHGNIKAEHAWTGQLQIAHSLRAEGFDASEDGTGRDTPLVPSWSLDPENLGDGGNIGWRCGKQASHTLNTNGNVGVAYGGNNTAGPIEVATAVNAHGGPHGRLDFESETFVAQAFNNTGQGWWNAAECAASVRKGDDAGGGGARESTLTLQDTEVRRLLPAECARLQGFPDDHCAIEFRGKPASDGSMYRAYGNSMAVPCLRWILGRVEAQSLQQRRAAA